jgi:hypothetical protein
MRYKVNLLEGHRTNYVSLPTDSPLRHCLQPDAGRLCQALKVTSLLTQRTHYFGFTGQASSSSECIDVSPDLARLLGLEQDSLVQVSVEYSFTFLSAVELEPVTVDDFELIEQHSAYVEEQLLNQVGVFYDQQRFCLWLGNASVRLVAKVNEDSSAKCFYLGVDSELHIQTKVRKREAPPTTIKDQEQVSEADAPIQDSGIKDLIVRHSSLVKAGEIELIGFPNATGKLVRVAFESRNSICRLDFKDYQTFVMNKQPLPISTEPIFAYFKAVESDLADPTPSARLDFRALHFLRHSTAELASLELVPAQT